MLSIKQLDFDVWDFIPIPVKAANVDGVHLWGGARVAERMNSAGLAEPMLGYLVSGLIESQGLLAGKQPEVLRWDSMM
jgi:hypothetical protein